jgi:hypothetical protein
MLHARFCNGGRLTARTLKSEVLPAFCSPIMVMSISVALHSASNQHPGLRIVESSFAFCRIRILMGIYQMAHKAAAGAVGRGAKGEEASIPEQAQEPVINAAEDARHDEKI